jgi:two-component system, NarL family, nitrate/nitrite response regulator NarL
MIQTKIKVVLADDNDFVRMGIRKLLKKAPNIELIGEARNGLEALKIVGEVEPDVLLLDVEMPFLDGIAVTRRLRASGPAKTRILVLSAYNDPEYIRGMLLNGASGYLLKDEAPERIIEAVQGIARGKTAWINPHMG